MSELLDAALALPLWRMEGDDASDEEIAAVLRFRKALEAAGRSPTPRRTIPGACGNCGAPSAENLSWNATGGWTCGACGESDYPEATE